MADPTRPVHTNRGVRHPFSPPRSNPTAPASPGPPCPITSGSRRSPRAIKEIEAGKLEKVVLARDHALWSKEPFELHRVLNKLHSGFPECMVYLVDGLVGASPELLIRRIGDAVSSLALAGSARRDADPVADANSVRSCLRRRRTFTSTPLPRPRWEGFSGRFARPSTGRPGPAC